MCGITGVFIFDESASSSLSCIEAATKTLHKRGPDNQGIYRHQNVALGHRRLSIIDTSSGAHQPFSDASGRYQMVFNGEIYNYKALRQSMEAQGRHFRTESDTEVLLQLFIEKNTAAFSLLNGFFAVAIYDQEEEKLYLARDRYGIKPLVVYRDEKQLIFASEMKALMAFGIPKQLDFTSLYTYLQLNYIPAPHSILQDVKKLDPGTYNVIDRHGEMTKNVFYQIPYPPDSGSYSNDSYETAQQKVMELLETAVQDRLVADVPLGTFLSGGIDSSLITALASRHSHQLNTFSIGYKDEPLFDETNYALEVAKKYKTNHHVFELTHADLLESLYETLDYLDEPFADSSALAVNVLSRKTREHVTVALSGDGADELFSGYNKHMGEYLSRKGGIKQTAVKALHPLWGALPKSRNHAVGNFIRKLDRFSEGSRLSEGERYWRWASLMDEAGASNLMQKLANANNYQKRKSEILNMFRNDDFNDVLYSDIKLVLQSDMLRKVDLMSMANSLEVRVPFLDHRLVNYVFSLPASYKINGQMKKRILQDAGRKLLPESLYNRPKHGFEVPLLNWFRGELKSLIFDDLLSDKFIKEQNLFNLYYVKDIRSQLLSTNPGDAQGNVWALIVFNQWWKKYMG